MTSGSGGRAHQGGRGVWRGAAVRFDQTSVREQLAGVLEDDHAVAEQAPALLRVAGDHSSRIMVDSVGGRALRLVRAHRNSPAGSCFGGTAPGGRVDPGGLANHSVIVHMTSDARYQAQRREIEQVAAGNREI